LSNNELKTQPPTTKDDSHAEKRGGPAFIPKLLGKKVKVQPLQGQPITGTLKGFNAYELLLEVTGRRGPIVVFKHAVYFIEEVA
jgi:sRNA-binding regulator protein Hfq